ncbi:uncharacterized protein LOC133961413 [Platichthys flesus]|uniref:uncharacterized protein LOC133961413 n=1 Tax=Platichthys flesus TaxID=8260 RepID=UPI002DB9B37B|nr:uncharacterized protein LOC133961413 [Platichthys flesus]
MARRFNGKQGDLIEISRGSYQHWAVYIGGQMVVHLVPEGGQSSGSSAKLSSTGEVKREKLTDVVGNDRYQVNNLLDDLYDARDPSIIVKEAREMVGRVLSYNVDTYNCEHFATDLRYGVAESRQFKGKPGDLIEIFRGLYQHWAVYIGENEVVNLIPEGGQSSGSPELPSSSNGNVKREKLAEVVGNDHYQVNNLLDDMFDARDPSVIVKEACEMVGRQLQYNRDTYNCEHFATEMRYGKAKSRQINGKPGDLIEIFRGSFEHWAVYIGEDDVVHLVRDGGQSSGSSANMSSSDGKVKCEKLTDVVGNDRYQVNNLLDDLYDARKPYVIAKEARAMVGRVLPYKVVTNNSEHFLTDLRYGKAESRQFKGKPGDLIEIFRGMYKHWAVYIGEDEVVHLVRDGCQSSDPFEILKKGNGSVLHQKLTDVVVNDRYRVNNLLDKKYDARDPSIIVKEARAMVGRQLQYDLVNNNCEHFATEMRYGKAKSCQVKKTLIAGSAGIMGILSASAASVATVATVAKTVAK